jgi:hypothetical protein
LKHIANSTELRGASFPLVRCLLKLFFLQKLLSRHIPGSLAGKSKIVSSTVYGGFQCHFAEKQMLSVKEKKREIKISSPLENGSEDLKL